METLSEHYISLIQRFESLSEKYLRDNSTIDGNFIPDLDNIATFIILMHAELEDYFETRAREALALAQSKFASNTIQSVNILPFIYIYLQNNNEQVKPDLQSKENITSEDSLKNYTQKALGYCGKFIKDNNGIKENSIIILSSMTGVLKDDMNTTLLAELNQIGKRRGGLVHKGRSKWRLIRSPSEEKDNMQGILTMIKEHYEDKK